METVREWKVLNGDCNFVRWCTSKWRSFTELLNVAKLKLKVKSYVTKLLLVRLNLWKNPQLFIFYARVFGHLAEDRVSSDLICSVIWNKNSIFWKRVVICNYDDMLQIRERGKCDNWEALPTHLQHPSRNFLSFITFCLPCFRFWIL